MRQRERGSSLLEVLVVIVVFGVGILGVMQIFPKALSILRSTREEAVAKGLVQQKLQQIKFQKWEWSGLSPDKTKKGFSLELPPKKNLDPSNWRHDLTPQKQNEVTEYLIPNENGLIYLSFIPLADSVDLAYENNNKLQKVDDVADLFQHNSGDKYFEPVASKGLGVYKVKKDPLQKTIKVTYKVKDWRTLSEDFLGFRNLEYRFSGQSIKKLKDLERDNQSYTGFWNKKDIVLIDLIEGEVIPLGRGNYDIDYKEGIISLKMLRSNNIPLRVYYQKKGEWYLQVLREQGKPTINNFIQKWIVRLYWNPHFFRFKNDQETDINTLNRWTEQYKMIELESF